MGALGDLLIFTGGAAASGFELWRSDGSVAGTSLLADIRPGQGDSYPALLTAAGSRVFFRADGGVNGQEPWVTDGTTVGTRIVLDIAPGIQPALARRLRRPTAVRRRRPER